VSLRLFGHRLSWLSLAARPALATAVFAGVLWASRGLGLLASSLLAGAAFAGATVLLRIWDPKERDLVRSLLQGAAADPTDLV